MENNEIKNETGSGKVFLSKEDKTLSSYMNNLRQNALLTFNLIALAAMESTEYAINQVKYLIKKNRK